MEPFIPDGAYCIFVSPVGGDLQGRIVLVQHRGIHDADTGASCSVKRFAGELGHTREGTPCWTRVRLLPINAAFDPIVLDPRDAAELVDVLPA